MNWKAPKVKNIFPREINPCPNPSNSCENSTTITSISSHMPINFSDSSSMNLTNDMIKSSDFRITTKPSSETCSSSGGSTIEKPKKKKGRKHKSGHKKHRKEISCATSIFDSSFPGSVCPSSMMSQIDNPISSISSQKSNCSLSSSSSKSSNSSCSSSSSSSSCACTDSSICNEKDKLFAPIVKKCKKKKNKKHTDDTSCENSDTSTTTTTRESGCIEIKEPVWPKPALLETHNFKNLAANEKLIQELLQHIGVSQEKRREILVAYDLFHNFKIVDCKDKFRAYSINGNETIHHLKFSFFGNGIIEAKDAKLANGKGHLKVDSQPFNITVPLNGCEGPTEDGFFDHYKFVVLTEKYFPCLPGHEIYFESCIAVQTCGTEHHPFSRNLKSVEDPYDDFRLATAGITMFDYDTHLLADVVMTNKGIYALYGRLPTCRHADSQASAAAFLSIVKIGTRGNCCDSEIVGIGYDRDKGLLKWYLNKNQVFCVNQIGHRPVNSKTFLVMDNGGIEQIICPKQFWLGFGTWTYLDAHKPNNFEVKNNNALVKLVSLQDYYFNPTRPDPETGLLCHDESFEDPVSVSSSRIWGQGATLFIKYLKVIYKTIYCK